MNRAQMLALCVAAACTGMSAFPAHADTRLVSREYNRDEVVRIDGKLGVQATIGFAANEKIENVAVGDSRLWQITPNKRADLLFVKPLEGGARTNMTVVTNKRTYFFDLVASSRAKPLYMLRFTYKNEDPAPAEASPSDMASLNGEEQADIRENRTANPDDRAMLNFAWARKGDAKLFPTRIYDDGEATYLLWHAKQSIPAILVRNERGEEGPVNYAVRGDTVVIDGVPALIVLRTGKARALLTNMQGDATAYAAQPRRPKPERPRFASGLDLPAPLTARRN